MDLEGSLRSGGWSWRARSTEQPCYLWVECNSCQKLKTPAWRKLFAPIISVFNFWILFLFYFLILILFYLKFHCLWSHVFGKIKTVTKVKWRVEVSGMELSWSIFCPSMQSEQMLWWSYAFGTSLLSGLPCESSMILMLSQDLKQHLRRASSSKERERQALGHRIHSVRQQECVVVLC